MGQTKSKPAPAKKNLEQYLNLKLDHSKILPDSLLFKWFSTDLKYDVTPEQKERAKHDGGVMYYQIGELNYESRLYCNAYTWFAKAAAQNNSSAQTSIGLMHERQDMGLVDNGMSMYWYMKAHLNDGNRHAQCSLGYIYDQGKGVPKNYETSIEWYEKSANQNHPLAQFSLARTYECLEDFCDLQKAVNWYKASYVNGFEMGKIEMERLMKKGYKPSYQAKEFAPLRLTDRQATLAEDIVVIIDTTMKNQKFSFEHSYTKHNASTSKQKRKIFQVNTSPNYNDKMLLKKRMIMMIETVQRMQVELDAINEA